MAASPWAAPSAPQGITATVKGKNVKVDWIAPRNPGGAPITDYVVEWLPNDGTSWTVVKDGVGTDTGASISKLAGKTTYLIRVAAVSDVGTGEWATVTVTVK